MSMLQFAVRMTILSLSVEWFISCFIDLTRCVSTEWPCPNQYVIDCANCQLMAPGCILSSECPPRAFDRMLIRLLPFWWLLKNCTSCNVPWRAFYGWNTAVDSNSLTLRGRSTSRESLTVISMGGGISQIRQMDDDDDDEVSQTSQSQAWKLVTNSTPEPYIRISQPKAK